MGNGRLTESHTHGVEVLEIAIRKIGITLCKIIDRFVHPVPLIFLLGLEDPTTIDVTEELVSSSTYSVFVRHYSLL
jgi:hypothetical protein